MIFITGVGTGIGKAACIKFLSKGFHVVGVLRNERHHNTLMKSVSGLNGELKLIYADLEDRNFVESVLGQLKDLSVSSLDAVVNVAGMLDTTMNSNASLEQIEKVMRVNYSNPTLLMSRLKSFLENGDNSNILNISSMSGYLGSVRFPGLAYYGASKAAISSVSESLSVEFSDSGIHINSLAIGAVNTEMLQNAFPDFTAQISPMDMAEYIFSFVTQGYKLYNGKVLPVAITNP